MTTTSKSITSGQTDRIVDLGKEAIKTAIIKVNPESDNAQTRIIAAGGEFKNRVEEAAMAIILDMITPNKYASQVVKSSYTYPKEYQRKPADKQVLMLAQKFNFDASSTLELLKTFPEHTENAEGNFAIVSPFGAKELIKGYEDPFDIELYCKMLMKMFDQISSERNFYNYRKNEIDSKHLRQTEKTLAAYRTLANTQGKNPIWIIPAQLGMLHRGESVNRARELFAHNEFGLGWIPTISIALTHPERFVRLEELDIDCAGDEFSPDGVGSFSKAPFVIFDDGRVKAGADDVAYADGYFGSASGFVPTSA